MLSVTQIRNAIKSADIQQDTDSLSVNKTFRELGLDSLDIFNIFLEIEELAGRKIPDEDYELLQSIEKIQRYLNKEK